MLFKLRGKLPHHVETQLYNTFSPQDSLVLKGGSDIESIKNRALAAVKLEQKI